MTLTVYSNKSGAKVAWKHVISLTLTESYNLFFSYWTSKGEFAQFCVYKDQYSYFDVKDTEEDPGNEILR